VTPVAFFFVESRLTRSTCDCVRSSKFLFLMATGRIVVCALAFAKCSQPKRSQKPQ
jgi:aspartate/tyrosine/aromatic aminotransferase